MRSDADVAADVVADVDADVVADVATDVPAEVAADVSPRGPIIICHVACSDWFIFVRTSAFEFVTYISINLVIDWCLTIVMENTNILVT